MAVDTTIALISLADLKAFSDIETSETDNDTRLENIIDAVSDFFNEYTGRQLLQDDDIDEYHDGDGGTKLYLKNRPINSTSSTISVWISTDTPRVYGDSQKIDSDSIVIDSESGIIHLLDTAFSEGVQTVKVTYDGGYATVPHRLTQACLEVCAKLWQRESSHLTGKSSFSVAGSSVVIEVEKDFTDFVFQVLEKETRFVD